MQLLSVGNDAKTVKGEKRGVLTGILYLLPSDSSGIINVCSIATPGCRASCLNTAGRGAFCSVQAGRMRKTKWFAEDKESFLQALVDDVDKLKRKAKRVGFVPAVRCNGTSDLYILGKTSAKAHPDVVHYDYTKIIKPWTRVLPNYNLTFSLSERNEADALDALLHDTNVAVVFNTKKGEPLPKDWRGYRVIDGDLSDLRFLDPSPVVVGLRAKGRAKKDCTGFVQIAGI